ncbi:molybdenum cofactor guanylyltransferase MobA [Limnobacter parvus]|uniref:Molybdenum cofactor guanylyltransferase n=1 Tax=Limnobacter parvus TaxID=2939690 RepID=A0ABT1XHX4_9BURK|nr:molybdenum cofactor guanylyltransferase MobA [Limnobacter parvus]MCR2746880.1 molybdenum cofactor guanylyltransferase [Limnobacter parvus]
MSISLDDITGVILAGGMGRRMGGIDKGLRNYKNAPLALHAMMRLSNQVGSICINANRNIGVYEGFGVEVVCDIQPDYAGPLAGMQAALSNATVPFLVTVPCDVPAFPTDLVKKLSEPFENNVSLMLTVAATKGRHHPVFCLMRTELLPSLEEFLRKGGRKIDAWYANIPHQAVEFGDEAAFHNVNTLEELKELEQKS